MNRHAVDIVHTTFARIALLEGDHFVIRAAYPIRILEHEFHIGDREPISALPYAQRALELNEPVIIRASDSDIDSRERAALLLGFTQSLCLIPLRVGGPVPNSRQDLGLLMLGEARSEARSHSRQPRSAWLEV